MNAVAGSSRARLPCVCRRILDQRWASSYAAAVQQNRPQFPQRPTPIDHTLESLSRQGDIVGILQFCRKLKDEGAAPTITVYKALVGALTSRGQYDLAIRAVNDMYATLDQGPDRGILQLLVVCATRANRSLTPVLAALEELDSQNWEGDHYVKQRRMEDAIYNGHVEQMCRLLAAHGNRQGSYPVSWHRETLARMAKLAARAGQTQMAIDIIKDWLKGPQAADSKPMFLTLSELLARAADELDHESTKFAWQHLLWMRKHLPTHVEPFTSETLRAVNNVGARYGDPDLCLEVLRTKSSQVDGFKPEEEDLAPIVEAMSKAWKMTDAIKMVVRMQNSHVSISPHTLLPLASAFADPWLMAPKRPSEERDASYNPPFDERAAAVDAAYELCLKISNKQGHTLPVGVLNALLVACSRLPDLVRALETYREYKSTFGLTPNLWTFEILLETCAKENRENALEIMDALFAEMKGLGLTPSEACFHYRIAHALSVRPEPQLDEALTFLEDIKAHDITPSLSTYSLIASTMRMTQDFRLAMLEQDAKAFGYDLRRDPGRGRMDHVHRGNASAV